MFEQRRYSDVPQDRQTASLLNYMRSEFKTVLEISRISYPCTRCPRLLMQIGTLFKLLYLGAHEIHFELPLELQLQVKLQLELQLELATATDWNYRFAQ